jgi:hypothetical protein
LAIQFREYFIGVMQLCSSNKFACLRERLAIVSYEKSPAFYFAHGVKSCLLWCLKLRNVVGEKVAMTPNKDIVLCAARDESKPRFNATLKYNIFTVVL